MTLEFDPLPSLRMWAVDTEIAGRALHIPPLPAADWLPCLMANDAWAILDLADEDPSVELLSDGLTVVELGDALRDVVAAVAGRSAQAALSIAVTAAGRWDLIGRHVARTGVRFDQIPIGMALDLLYDSIMQCLDKEQQEQFNRDLEDPATRETGATRFTALAGQPPPTSAAQYAGGRPKTRIRTPQDHPDAQTGAPTRRPVRRGRASQPAPVSPASETGPPDRLVAHQPPGMSADGPVAGLV